MNRWEQIEKICHAALELEESQRASFLERACGGDQELTREVESLLRFANREDRFIEEPALEVAQKMITQEKPGSLIGQQIGSYQIISLLGAGSMGAIYKARDARLNRFVAIKILPVVNVIDPERKRRFIQEARAASALNHPNIVTIYDIGGENSVDFIVMEYVPGKTLDQQIPRQGMCLGEALKIAIQMADALAKAHSAGIIHRDLKPSNVMVTDDLVKVLDFGIAKLTEVAEGDHATTCTLQSETAKGTILGTASYMSPEQARGLKLDARTDIFSLGVILYEMVAGCRPFAGSTMSDVIAAILDRHPLPLVRYSREAPYELERIVSKALAKEREERYQTAKDLLIDLKRLNQQLDFEAELERSGHSGSKEGAGVRSSAVEPTDGPALGQASRGDEAITVSTMPIAASLLSVITRRWLAVSLVVGILALVAAATVYFVWRAERQAIDSVAVLPFVNMSSDPHAEDLSDSVTESIYDGLSQLPQLKVKSRGTVYQYSGGNIDPETVGLELGVHAVLSGRIIQRGEGLSISLELFDVRHSNILWSEQYKVKLADTLATQEEISRQMAGKLRLSLGGDERKRLEAYQLYLRGRHHWSKRTREDLQQAIKYFQRAVDKDPDYAPGYVGLADCYNMLVVYNALPPRTAFPEAKTAAEKALRLDDSLAEAHTSLSYAKWKYDWDWIGAEAGFKRAIDLNASYAPARQFYASFLASMGRLDEAVTEIKRTQELNPLSPIINADVAWIYYLVRQPDKAIEQCRLTLQLDPDFFPVHRYLGLAYEQKAMYGEAVAELKRAVRLSGESTYSKATLGHIYAVSGKRGEAQKLIEDLERLSMQGYVSAYDIATIYAGLGDKDRAFQWLEKAYEEHSSWLCYLKVYPMLDNLWSDPRFADLLSRVGVPR
jgi:serine/threonine protein kinase/Flp pilus assembly protein TadD